MGAALLPSMHAGRGRYLQPNLPAALRALVLRTRPGGVVVINVPSAHRAGAARYAALERLVRRRVHRRSNEELLAAAALVGAHVQTGPVRAGVTDVYLLRRIDDPVVPAPR